MAITAVLVTRVTVGAAGSGHPSRPAGPAVPAAVHRSVTWLPAGGPPGPQKPLGMTLSRRALLQTTALGALAAAGPLPAWAATGPAGPRTVTLSATVVGTGSYTYLPFQVPRGVNRIDVTLTKSDPAASVGLGLFDQRGTGYQSPGFRGVFGAERSTFFLTAAAATDGFVPGPIEPGTWTVLVPVFTVHTPTVVTAHVTLSFGPPGPAFAPGAEVGVVRAAPSWYRGDLHCHTVHSSDAWASGSAMTPAQWANACRAAGLDYVAMTDHNVISQNYHLARDAGADVLLMPGEEMTNWFHGHATVSGIQPGEWLDWRQSPLGLPLPTGGARISEFIRVAESMGAYVAVAHPYAAQLTWQFLPELEIDPASRPHGFEVWTGLWQPDDEAALRTWDTMLQRGLRVAANGGSDLHGVRNSSGIGAGTPTTVVYAAELSKPGIVSALRAGRSFITRRPRGTDVYLTASKPGQATYTGGSVYGGAGDVVTVRARVLRGAGYTLGFVADGAQVATVPLTGEDQNITVEVPLPPGGGYVRTEVRGEPRLVPSNAMASDMGMQAFTNPIWLVDGPTPAGYTPEYAPVSA